MYNKIPQPRQLIHIEKYTLKLLIFGLNTHESSLETSLATQLLKRGDVHLIHALAASFPITTIHICVNVKSWISCYAVMDYAATVHNETESCQNNLCGKKLVVIPLFKMGRQVYTL